MKGQASGWCRDGLLCSPVLVGLNQQQSNTKGGSGMNVVALRAPQEEVRLDPAESAFQHWQHVMGYKRARLDQKRRKTINDRLKDGYSLQDLQDAINGCYLSPFHHDGENERQTRYDDIALILRDAEHVDRFIKLYELGQARLDRWQDDTPEPVSAAPASAEHARTMLDQMKRLLGRR
jgi:hypothetical protein